MYVYCCHFGSYCNHCAHGLATGLVSWLHFLLGIGVKVLCTDSQHPEDRFAGTDVASHYANGRGETLNTLNGGDIVYSNVH